MQYFKNRASPTISAPIDFTEAHTHRTRAITSARDGFHSLSRYHRRAATLLDRQITLFLAFPPPRPSVAITQSFRSPSPSPQLPSTFFELLPTTLRNYSNMLGSRSVQALRQFSTTAVRRSHAYEGPGKVSIENNIES